jgi:hypothetical protein
LFAEYYEGLEISRNPDYYDGITRADLQQARDDVIRDETAFLEDHQKRAGHAIIYGKSHAVDA